MISENEPQGHLTKIPMVGNLFPHAAIFFENRFHSKNSEGIFRARWFSLLNYRIY
jgi:hypothetical protein